MSVDIKVVKGADGVEYLLKISPIAFLCGDAFIIRRESGVSVLYDMGGADDKVEVIAF